MFPIEVIIIPVVFLIVGGFLGYRLSTRRRVLTPSAGDVGRLEEALEQLRADHQRELSELQERLDFSERVLAQLRRRAPGETNTPV